MLLIPNIAVTGFECTGNIFDLGAASSADLFSVNGVSALRRLKLSFIASPWASCCICRHEGDGIRMHKSIHRRLMLQQACSTSATFNDSLRRQLLSRHARTSCRDPGQWMIWMLCSQPGKRSTMRKHCSLWTMPALMWCLVRAGRFWICIQSAYGVYMLCHL